MTDSTNKRIAKNSVYLYLRMMVTLVVSLYTSRVMLEVLGVRDYGIYNVVGGMVVLLSFLNGTMSGTTQRFLNFEMGKAKEGKLRETFASAWLIHITVAIVLLILGETVGLWFVNTQLVIAPERMQASNWTYQFSLFGGLATILQVPFSGAILAHERMNAYAWINLTFTFLKLIVTVALLFFAAIDTLVIYAGLIFCVTLIMALMYAGYCLAKFPECTLAISANVHQIKAMLKYSLSDLIGTTCYTVENQGVIVILNRIGGTVLNAAGGLTMTVGSAISQVGTSIIMAFRPQIIQQYAAKEYTTMQSLLTNCSKFAMLLMAIFAIPCFIDMHYLLSLWLKEVPPHTETFCRLTLIAMLSMLALQTINAAMHATGHIFYFSLFTGLSYLIELPIMYYMIVYTGNPSWAYYLPLFQLAFCVCLVAWMFKRRLPQFRAMRFVWKGYMLPWLVIMAVGILMWTISPWLGSGFIHLVIVTAINAVILALAAWLIAFDHDSRTRVLQFVKSRVNK